MHDILRKYAPLVRACISEASAAWGAPWWRVFSALVMSRKAMVSRTWYPSSAYSGTKGAKFNIDFLQLYFSLGWLRRSILFW